MFSSRFMSFAAWSSCATARRYIGVSHSSAGSVIVTASLARRALRGARARGRRACRSTGGSARRPGGPASPARPGCGSRARAPRAGDASRAGGRRCRTRARPGAAPRPARGRGVDGGRHAERRRVHEQVPRLGERADPRAELGGEPLGARARCGSRPRPSTPSRRSANTTARAAPPAPSTVARLPAHGPCGSSARSTPIQSVFSASSAPPRAVSVFAAPIARAPSLARSASRSAVSLCGSETQSCVRPRARSAGERGRELARRDVEDLEARVETQRAIGRGVQDRRERVPGRMQDDAAERRAHRGFSARSSSSAPSRPPSRPASGGLGAEQVEARLVAAALVGLEIDHVAEPVVRVRDHEGRAPSRQALAQFDADRRAGLGGHGRELRVAGADRLERNPLRDELLERRLHERREPPERAERAQLRASARRPSARAPRARTGSLPGVAAFASTSTACAIFFPKSAIAARSCASSFQ